MCCSIWTWWWCVLHRFWFQQILEHIVVHLDLMSLHSVSLAFQIKWRWKVMILLVRCKKDRKRLLDMFLVFKNQFKNIDIVKVLCGKYFKRWFWGVVLSVTSFSSHSVVMDAVGFLVGWFVDCLVTRAEELLQVLRNHDGGLVRLQRFISQESKQLLFKKLKYCGFDFHVLRIWLQPGTTSCIGSCWRCLTSQHVWSFGLSGQWRFRFEPFQPIVNRSW